MTARTTSTAQTRTHFAGRDDQDRNADRVEQIGNGQRVYRHTANICRLVLDLFFLLLAGPVEHAERQDQQNDPAGDADRAAGDVQKPHQQRAAREQHNRRDEGHLDHLDADFTLLMRLEMFGFLQERNQRDFRPHADEHQDQKVHDHRNANDGKIHGHPLPFDSSLEQILS